MGTVPSDSGKRRVARFPNEGEDCRFTDEEIHKLEKQIKQACGKLTLSLNNGRQTMVARCIEQHGCLNEVVYCAGKGPIDMSSRDINRYCEDLSNRGFHYMENGLEWPDDIHPGKFVTGSSVGVCKISIHHKWFKGGQVAMHEFGHQCGCKHGNDSSGGDFREGGDCGFLPVPGDARGF